MTSKLVTALRRKYKSPREALKALGIDERLLEVKRLAFDAAPGREAARRTLHEHLSGPALRRALEMFESEPEDVALLLGLEDIVCEELSGEARERAQALLDHQLGGGEYDYAYQTDDEDVDEKIDEDLLERVANEVFNQLENKTGRQLDEVELNEVRDAIKDQMAKRRNGDDRRRGDDRKRGRARDAELPTSALEGGMGGRIEDRRRGHRISAADRFPNLPAS